MWLKLKSVKFEGSYDFFYRFYTYETAAPFFEKTFKIIIFATRSTNLMHVVSV